MSRYKTIPLLTLIFLSAFAAFAQSTGKSPVIIIPGITGSDLVNPKTGKTVWFSLKRDKEDDLRLPMRSPVLSANRDSLVPKDIIRKVELSVLPDVEVYQSLIDALKSRGYTEGNWDKPEASDVFYVFPYDWRRDNVETARLLFQRIEKTKRLLKRPKLKFDILAHSMGGLIARYAAMYGKAEPPATASPKPTWAGAIHIDKLMMFGTPNEGAMDSLNSLINGYPIVADRKLPFIDDLRPEDVMSNPSGFQLLPHQNSARFLDENLQPMNVDIYNIDTWIKYGWGAIADPKFLSKLKGAPQTGDVVKKTNMSEPTNGRSYDDLLVEKTTYAQVRSYFISALTRAKRFQAALDAPSPSTPIRIFAYGGNCSETLDAVVIVRDEKNNRWETIVEPKNFKGTGGKEIKKDAVKAAIYAIGDGRVTQRSLLSETSVNGGPVIENIAFALSFFACGTHTKLFLAQAIQDSFLSALVVEKAMQP
ncbi:MAG TPA: hypothetical protein PLP21_07260 [Pyrinomonadaceae bacterium]|nr:hypothetical protein [Acidobacteriota bacterium]HQZ96102.1 hypothetical protein [Pyrinomonadaceae bacterium]